MKTSTVVAALLVAGIAVVMYVLLSGSSSLPPYATRHPMIKEAYMFAQENPDALNGVNCYCGCMQHEHSGRIHSRGLLDCFKNSNNFERHASECDMCIKDALEVKQMTMQGKTKDEIRRYIDGKYA